MPAQSWFITGVSSGIGRHLAELLLARGDRVAGTLRTGSSLDELKGQHGERLRLAALDVTDAAAVRAIVDDAFKQLGRIDVVVSNAGYGLFGAAEELTDDQIDLQISTNLMGSIQVIRAVLPHLRRQGGGRIIQVSSAGGQTTYPGFSVYHATKWGIEGFVETVAKEVAPFGIEFTIAEPGATRTRFGANLISPPPMPAYLQTPVEEVRRAITGHSLPINGDPRKIAQAIIDSAEVHPAPLRLTLGRDTYHDVHKSLADRLSVLEQQREMAHSIDVDAVKPAGHRDQQ